MLYNALSTNWESRWSVVVWLMCITCVNFYLQWASVSWGTESRHVNAPLNNLCFCVVRRTSSMTPSSPQPSGLIILPQTGDTLLNAPQNFNFTRNPWSRTARRCVLSLQQNVCLQLKDCDSEKQQGWVSSLNICTLMGTRYDSLIKNHYDLLYFHQGWP